MKNIWYAIVACVLLNSAVSLQAIMVHGVLMAQKDGKWHVLLGVPAKQDNWDVFSAEVKGDEKPWEKANEAVKSKTHNEYPLKIDAITRRDETTNDIFYFSKVQFIKATNITKEPGWFKSPLTDQFTWVSVEDLRKPGHKIKYGDADAKIKPLAELQKYLKTDDLIDELAQATAKKSPLQKSLGELTTKLNDLTAKL